MKIPDEAVEIAEGLRDNCLVGNPPLESTMKLAEGILHYRTYVEELENELKEEARLQGMGGEREARLISELKEKQKYILQLESMVAKLRKDAQFAGCAAQSRQQHQEANARQCVKDAYADRDRYRRVAEHYAKAIKKVQEWYDEEIAPFFDIGVEASAQKLRHILEEAQKGLKL